MTCPFPKDCDWMKNIVDPKCKSNAEENENISKAVADRKSPVVVAVAKSALGQGPPWSAGWWHSRCTPSFRNHRTARHLRFVPTAEVPSSSSLHGCRLL